MVEYISQKAQKEYLENVKTRENFMVFARFLSRTNLASSFYPSEMHIIQLGGHLKETKRNLKIAVSQILEDFERFQDKKIITHCGRENPRF